MKSPSLLSTFFFTVPAAMITSATPEKEKKKTLQRLQMLAERSVNRAEKEIKLVYVTVSSFRLVSMFFYAFSSLKR